MLTKSDPDSRKAGNWIIIGGLALQLIFFGFFVLVALIFHVRIVRAPTSRSVSDRIPWQNHMYILYTTSALIMIRSVFRTVEYVQGNNGYLLRKELWLYIFDATLMWLTIALMNIIHPSEVKALLRGGKPMKMMVLTRDLQSVSSSGEFVMESSKGPNAVDAC